MNFIFEYCGKNDYVYFKFKRCISLIYFSGGCRWIYAFLGIDYRYCYMHPFDISNWFGCRLLGSCWPLFHDAKGITQWLVFRRSTKSISRQAERFLLHPEDWNKLSSFWIYLVPQPNILFIWYNMYLNVAKMDQSIILHVMHIKTTETVGIHLRNVAYYL